MTMSQIYENKINRVPQSGVLTTREPSGGAPDGSLKVGTCTEPHSFPRQGDEEEAKRQGHCIHGRTMGRIVDRPSAVGRAVSGIKTPNCVPTPKPVFFLRRDLAQFTRGGSYQFSP